MTRALSADDARLYAFQRNVVCAASAGTGKTHRLTSLLALSCLGLTSRGQRDPREAAAASRPERVWATTYTRAAAQEIHARTARVIEAVARGEHAATAPAFAAVIAARAAELDAPPDERELRTRAASALATFSLARIDTLHGLAGRLLRAAGDAAWAQARVLEPVEHRAIEARAIEDGLEAALAPGHPLERAAQNALDAAGRLDGLKEAISKLFERLDEEGIEPRDLALPDHVAGARATLQLVRDVAFAAGQDDRADLAADAGELARRADALLDGRGTSEDRRAVAAKAAAVFKASKRSAKHASSNAALAALCDSQPGTLQEKAAHFATMIAVARELGVRDEGVRDLLHDARARSRGARARLRAASFGDLLRRTRDLLRDDRAFGRRAREAHDVLLVDEFQDTSAVQRDVVYLLRERGDRAEARPRGELARARDVEPHGLFIVGDRKQAIYGFRGADVSVFCEACADLAGEPACDALALPRPSPPSGPPVADFVALRESRRSARRVVELVNAFCERDFGPATGRSFESPYTPAEALEAMAEAAPGRVALIGRADAASAPSSTSAPPSTSTPAPTPPSASTPASASTDPPATAEPDLPAQMRDADLAARAIEDAIRAGARPSSFAVLARRRSTLPFVELALGRRGVPYAVAGRAFFDAREVRDCAAILRLLVDPSDRLALAITLRGPAACLSDSALVLLSTPRHGLRVPLDPQRGRAQPAPTDDDPFAEALALLDRSERERLEAFRGRFAAIAAAAPRMSAADVVRLVVRELELDAVLAALPRAAARVGNLDRLVALAAARGGGLASFSRWLDACIEDEVDEREAAAFEPHEDAVTLMTMHASKGLDFERIVVVDWGHGPLPASITLGMFKREPPGAPPGSPARATLVVRHNAPKVTPGELTSPLASAPTIALDTPIRREALDDARARELAERRRLTYVALTRAKSELWICVPGGKAARGSPHATLVEMGAPEMGPSSPRFSFVDVDEAQSVGSAPHSPHIAGNGGAAPLLDDASPGGVDAAAMLGSVVEAAPTITIATTPLALFRTCARRYRLRLLLGIDEGSDASVASQLDLFGAAGAHADALDELGLDDALADGDAAADPASADDAGEGDGGPLEDWLPPDLVDPRALGTAAHRVLERLPLGSFGDASGTDPEALRARLAREGLASADRTTARAAAALSAWIRSPYAARLPGAARVLREEPFLLTLPSPEPAGAALRLRGAIDLIVIPSDESAPIDVLDYKLARESASLSAHAFQLRAYALVARRRWPGRAIRAGVVYLGDGARPEPLFLGRGDRAVASSPAGPAAPLSEDDHDAFERELIALAARFAAARGEDRWPGVEPAKCRAARCGFVRACHAKLT